jgi:hypothetical protein
VLRIDSSSSVRDVETKFGLIQIGRFALVWAGRTLLSLSIHFVLMRGFLLTEVSLFTTCANGELVKFRQGHGVANTSRHSASRAGKNALHKRAQDLLLAE